MTQQKLGRFSLKTLGLVLGVMSAISNQGFSAEKAKEQNRAPQAVDPKPAEQSAAEVAPPVSREEMRDHVSLALVGMGNIAQATYEVKTKFGTGTQKLAGKMSPGAGILLNLPFNGGAHWVISNESLVGWTGREGQMSTTLESSRWIKFSNLIRVAPIDFLSVGIGPYVSKGVGNVSYTRQGKTYQASFEEAGLNTFDYGVEAALGARLGVSQSLGLIADARYSQGIANLAKSPKRTVLGIEIEQSARYNEATFLLGISLKLN